MLSDLAPAKRMWVAFRAAQRAVTGEHPQAADYAECLRQLRSVKDAFGDWTDRNHLPAGVTPDPDTDLTLLYVNNTLYGELSDGGWFDFPRWRTRGTTLRVTLYNGDYFEHGYLNMDFGGARGWENQFKPTIKLGGSGADFTFGRFHWNQNLKSPVLVPPARRRPDGSTELARHRVFLTFNFDPSRRLRCYQFDPLHHDVAIFSLH
ncbi:MAG: hypothetical protein LBV60_26195, partial [Streptomyces sp.]|jgi:hypothetical protein|nr:hypothetical protein [Streptomyces sp.]